MRWVTRGSTLLASALTLALGASFVAACSAEGDPDTAEGALIDPSQTPMSKAELDAIVSSQGIQTLDALPGALPKDFLINFTLKHGKLRVGERGHLVERDVSQSSDPEAPRAVLWDERSGFTISYNGGTAGQTEGNRLDVIEFDEAQKKFHFSGLVFGGNGPPVEETDATIIAANRKCSHCHGPEPRPIFSMYPDWPSFYGSDNDELTDVSKEVQRIELRDYKAFRQHVSAAQPPRYLPLFDPDNVRTRLLGTKLYETFPYRPDIDTQIQSTSRSFAFRPSLRYGILANRTVAQMAAQKIVQHASFAKYGELFLHELLQCRWSSPAALTSSGWSREVQAAIGAAPRTIANGTTLHYRDALKIFDLSVRDIDIRYSYNHAGYDNDDASTKVMEVGYIDGTYWNSYFDGSATIDELLAMHLYETLSADPAFAHLRGLIPNPDGLEVKYSRLTGRYAFDKNFFLEMDKKGKWIPIPYPRAKLDAVHHREGYPERFASQHRALCGALEAHLMSTSTPAPPSTATTCPANCVASKYCKDNPNASGAIQVNGRPCVVAGAGGCQPCR